MTDDTTLPTGILGDPSKKPEPTKGLTSDVSKKAEEPTNPGGLIPKPPIKPE